MAVVIETTLGDITVDLFVEKRPLTCMNFLKLCKMKYYNFNLFHTIQHGFIAQTGDPTGKGDGGQSIWGVLEGPQKQYFEAEEIPKIKHSDTGLISMVGLGNRMVGSQFFITLAADLSSLDGQHCVIGEVTEGMDILRLLNETICDPMHRPYQDVRITHTVILDDPFKDPVKFTPPSRSPSPSAERLAGGRIAPDEEIDDTKGKSEQEIVEMIQAREAKARATILEIVGDLPDAEMAPPENVLFVCKLNPVTSDDDLEIIFSRFGKINSCEVIRDKKSGDSLQYAFIEFDNKKSCEDAYFKMDNVLIDDRRIHVDFSQSVSKIKWRGKGRGVIHMDSSGRPLPGSDFNPNNDSYKNQTRKTNNDRRRDRSEDSPARTARRDSRDRYDNRTSGRSSYNKRYSPKREYKKERDSRRSDNGSSTRRRYSHSRERDSPRRGKDLARRKYSPDRDDSSPDRKRNDSPKRKHNYSPKRDRHSRKTERDSPRRESRDSPKRKKRSPRRDRDSPVRERDSSRKYKSSSSRRDHSRSPKRRHR